MDGFIVSLCLLVAAFPTARSNGESSPRLNERDVDLCTGDISNVTRLSTDVWIISNNHSHCTNISKPQILRISTKSENASVENPLVFVTRMGSSVQTWHLPLRTQTFYDYYNSSNRTICSYPSIVPITANFPVYMDVFTSSMMSVKYSFEINLVKDFELSLNENNKFAVSPTDSQVYYFKFPDHVSTVRVVLSSPVTSVENCAIVSVQNASCPVNDQLENARSKGVYQTMMTSASLTITAEVTVKGREFFVVVVSANNSICNKRKENGIVPPNRAKDLTHSIELIVEEVEPASQYILAIVVPVIVFFLIGFCTLLSFCYPCFHCYYTPFVRPSNCLKVESACSKNDNQLVEVDSGADGEEQRIINHSKINIGGAQSNYSTSHHGMGVSETDGGDERERLLGPKHSYGGTGGEEEEGVKSKVSSTAQSPEQSLGRSGIYRELVNTGEGCVMLPDLMKTKYSSLESQYKVYGWNTITVGIFYALPAFQLVFSEQLILDANGDQDICYYNFKCARPYSPLSAFNNVWSNIGYFILGLSFLSIVGIRDYKAHQQRKKNKKHLTHGVPQFLGIYYAMGSALVMEAWMSAFYHICPSDNNFQFDTAFMFIIGGLLVVKMLQSRHPDLHADAFIAFFCFAIVIFLTFVGIWEWSKAYWQTNFTFVLLGLIGITVFAISFYFYHDWTFGYWIKKSTYIRIYKWFRSWCVPCNSKENVCKLLPKHPYRFIKMVLLVAVNIVIGIVMVLIHKGIATVVLALFVSNFLVLLVLYICCKLRYRESITLKPVVFLIVLAVFWGFAFYFYFNNVSQWEGSPAESREKNANCVVFNFYDNHDIWHFLSAAAMFFSFLFLLTLDDGTELLERKKIHTF